jgi:uncharacterized protein
LKVKKRKSEVTLAVLVLLLVTGVSGAVAQPPPPALTAPVNDFANILSEADEAELDKHIRALLEASGDVVVVATVESIAPYADIREYAVRMFGNQGRGIGQKGKNNGALVLLALKERQVFIEPGYDLEEFITDGFAGSTSREVMAPYFRKGEYGAGVRAGVTRVIQRIADGRGITVTGLPPAPRAADRISVPPAILLGLFVLLILVILSLSRASVSRRRRRRWGGGPWSGWDSGVGPFGGWGGSGGTFGGGFGGFGGGRGGGFGGFGGGRTGGGGGGASW